MCRFIILVEERCRTGESRVNRESPVLYQTKADTTWLCWNLTGTISIVLHNMPFDASLGRKR